MKLNSNSISSKLYKWFYGTEGLPNNLCPYFWKLVLAWLILIPYSMVCIPVILSEIFDKDYKYYDNSTGKRIGFSLLIYFMVFVVFSMLSLFGLFFIEPEVGSLYMNMVITGVFVWITTVVIGIIEGVKYFKEWNRERKIKYDESGRIINNRPTEKKPLLIVEFIRAKYNRYCPKIEWVSNNKSV